MKTALVTGGAGFIGSHLTRALLADGVRVRVLDNFSTGAHANLEGLDIEIIAGDLRDKSALAGAAAGVDEIFHHAAFISVPQSLLEPQECYDVNVQGTLNLLDAARDASVRKVVLASSCAVYGDSPNLPLGEHEPCAPLSPYAASKQINEIFAGLYNRLYGLDVTALRYFNVYGPRQAPDSPYAAVIPIFIRRWLSGAAPVVHGDGSQRRDFVFVEDIVRANLAAAAASGAAGMVFNVCTGIETSILDLLHEIGDLLAHPPLELRAALGVRSALEIPPFTFAEARSGDIYRSLGDPQAAAQRLDFRTRFSLREGLLKTILALV